MTRNANSRFALNPTNIDMPRSKFTRNSSHKLTFNVGDLIPFYVDEVLPGDTFQIKTSKVVRMQTLITPLMDNLYLDTYYFFVPNRLVWQNWVYFMGQSPRDLWEPTRYSDFSVPQLESPEAYDVSSLLEQYMPRGYLPGNGEIAGFQVGSVADYMGIPTGIPGLSVNALPFRAYALICNDWFRDENLVQPLNISYQDGSLEGVYGVYTEGNALSPIAPSSVNDPAKGGRPFKVAKYHDYFTSALPTPQKGPDVEVSVTAGSKLPVYALAADFVPDLPTDSSGGYVPLTGRVFDSSDPSNPYRKKLGMDSNYSTFVEASGSRGFAPENLWAISDGNTSVMSINELRTAFQIQKFYEKSARGGTRYVEIIKSMFGVTSPDARMQRPEYLGGNRVPIRINQVVQQSATDEVTPQGNVAGFSMTTDVNGDFIRSFTEHGFVIGVMCARYDHSYQQGIEKFWSRKTKFDYYWPVFANIGEQPIFNKEIYAQGTEEDDEVFGYQEAWADYRYKPSRVSGEMRSNAPSSLDFWHLADDYEALPRLSASWITEDSSNVDRAIAVSERLADQLFADIYVENTTTRPMPLYSIPGLIDHH